MNPDTNEQPLIPDFSPYEGEKENLSLTLEHTSGYGFSRAMGSWVQCAKISFFGEFMGRGNAAAWFRSSRALLIFSMALFAALSTMAATVKILLPPETGSFKPGPNSELANGQC